MNLNKIKTKLKRIHFINDIYLNILYRYQCYLFKKDPKILANYSFKKAFGRDIDWENPKNLIEKIIWQQFNTDTSLWTKCADKYLVREYIEEKGHGDMLTKLYGKYDSVDEIDFDSLPDSFVVKTNNASGTVMLVKDKNKLDIPKAKKTLDKWLKKEYGIINAQLHYLKIKPCIVIEEFLKDDKYDTLVDYKFHCINGVPQLIFVVSEREIVSHNFSTHIYDVNWEDKSDKYCKTPGKLKIEKPASFDKMVEACLVLAKDIPHIRIDFYEVNGRPYFGEMTFTTGFGFLKDVFYDELGGMISIKNNIHENSVIQI